MKIKTLLCEIKAAKSKWQEIIVLTGKSDIAGVGSLCHLKSEIPVIQSLFVHPRWRRLGVCKMIVEEAIRVAKKFNKEGISLVVEKNNKDAYEVYKKLGFVTTYDTENQRWMSILFS